MPPVCLDTPHMFGCPLYVLMMFGCPLYIHNTRKACFVRLRGFPYAPIHVDGPMFGCPPVCLDGPHMFGHPYMFGCLLYVWISSYVWTPPYVWMPLVCLDDVWMPTVHIQHKKACFVRLRVCPYASIHLYTPICLDAPCMFGCPLYAWMPPYVWMHPLYV